MESCRLPVCPPFFLGKSLLMSILLLFVWSAVTIRVTAEQRNASTTLRNVVLVGNNWDGTVAIFDPVSFKVIRKINVVPDLKERLRAMWLSFNPSRIATFLGSRFFIGKAKHNQLVDDVFISIDGKVLFISRPSLGDVLAMDVVTETVVWRTTVPGYRSDHSALSADGAVLLVSCTVANAVLALNTTSGRELGRWTSGDAPHENNFGASGLKIYHASIGRPWIPTIRPRLDFTKGQRVFQIVDNTPGKNRYTVLQTIDMADKLQDFYNGIGQNLTRRAVDSAVRPMAVMQNEQLVYFQISFFHGFFEYDLNSGQILRQMELPIPEPVQGYRPKDYQVNSAHHGLALNHPFDTKLCVAATVSGYVAIVDRVTFAYQIVPLSLQNDTNDLALKASPYWATPSADGLHCYVSAAGQDRVVVVDFATAKLVASVATGDRPQRIRTGRMVTV
jgi:DNA-binding beta-propeller fold protein YncE